MARAKLASKPATRVENIDLGLIDHQVFVPKFTIAAIIQKLLGDTSHCLEELLPTQSFTPIRNLLIAFTNSKILLIFSYLILQLKFLNS